MAKVGMIYFRRDLPEYGVDFSKTSPCELGEHNVCMSRGTSSWVAATKGTVVCYQDDFSKAIKKIENCNIVILAFLGNKQLGNLNDVMAMSLLLKEMGKIVLLHYGEALGNLKKDLLSWPDFISELVDLTNNSECDGLCYPASGNLTQLWEQIGFLTNKPIEYVPFCFHKPDFLPFRIPLEKRNGIVVPRSTFLLDCPRATLENVIVASRLREPTSIIWQRNYSPEQVKHLKSLFADKNRVDILFKPPTMGENQFAFSWHEYLNIIARHRICIDMDIFYSYGGFAGDSLLVNVPCLGGNSNTTRMAFPGLISDSSSLDEVVSVGERLLKDDVFYKETIKEMDRKLENELSFENNIKIWEEIYNRYKNK